MSHDMTKPTKWVCAQRRLRSALASAQSDKSSLSAWRKLRSLATHWAHSEDSDQTGRMPRLIWVFAGCTLILLVLSCRVSHNLFDFPLICQSQRYSGWVSRLTIKTVFYTTILSRILHFCSFCSVVISTLHIRLFFFFLSRPVNFFFASVLPSSFLNC